jgi:hypothetical protein
MPNLEQQFNALVAELAPLLTADDVKMIRELVDANELGVAFENFCVQLQERDVVCFGRQFDRIAAIGEAMGIARDYWSNIMRE